MNIKYNKFIAWILNLNGFACINLFGFLFVSDRRYNSKSLINHEQIHTAQMKELLYIPFYIMYVFEWIIKLFIYKFNGIRAYRNISFEREAYSNQYDYSYLGKRKRYNWMKLIK